MIPSEYLVPYLVSNTISLALLVAALFRPTLVRWAFALIFLLASIANTNAVLTNPEQYLDYDQFAFLEFYVEFIHGPFAANIPAFVLTVAACQLIIALSLAGPRRSRWLGFTGAIIFLVAIAPLGVGSAFPATLLMAAALGVTAYRLRGDANRE